MNQTTIKFKDWFANKLTVGAFPLHVNTLIEAGEYDIIINVSDEWYRSVEEFLISCNIRTYWFPMNERIKDMGLNSIYGALVILRHAEELNLRVYLHCHQGKNRSQIVKAAYYFVRTGLQLEEPRGGFVNMLEAACSRGYLPPRAEMQKWLKEVGKGIVSMQGGILEKSKINSIRNF